MNLEFYYGIDTNKHEVTQTALSTFCRENRLSIPLKESFNDLFGDVLPGVKKKLYVCFLDDQTMLELPEIRSQDYFIECKRKEFITRTTPLDLCQLLSVDKIFLLNLAHRTDRLAESRREFEKFCIPESQWERFPAYLGDDLIVQEMYAREYGIYCTKQSIGRATNGAFGCLLTHRNMISLAKSRGYKRVLVLEDDFQITPEFVDEVLLRKIGSLDFDMFYFCTTTMAPPTPTSDPDFVRVKRAFAACAYIVYHTIFDTIIDDSLNYGAQIDVFYADIIQSKYNTYSLPKSVITQKSGFSDIEKQNVDYKF